MHTRPTRTVAAPGGRRSRPVGDSSARTGAGAAGAVPTPVPSPLPTPVPEPPMPIDRGRPVDQGRTCDVAGLTIGFALLIGG